MRKLTPELLDHLPHEDAAAIASRQDLRRVNFFMGNEAWIFSKISKDTKSLTEIGAGDGFLLQKISQTYPDTAICAYDLAPRPEFLNPQVKWLQGDLFAEISRPTGGTLIANLFLHHFTDECLSSLAAWFSGFDQLIFNEPLRARLPLALGCLAWPFIHPVTRHDMRVSIEAGFIPGELPKLLSLSNHGFHFKEETSLRGSLRLLAAKRKT